MKPALTFFPSRWFHSLQGRGRLSNGNRITFRLLDLETGARKPSGCAHDHVDEADADGLFAELESRLRGLPAERCRPPREQLHGQRGF
ncbi:hypothetical protein SAMN06295937_101265 [Sphingopyxis flava]|uniref:Uncharacterized protein n=1 Tax=Sphingopyxis flava TaxID=1507287 RepID=A0A1T5D0E3_9SPHN|nr:hypothetical protein SAMN06295937_101265 [Sphingopyxis flava]